MGAHSPDGTWWWDGPGWVPAIGPHGAQWFDGQHWVNLIPRWHRPSSRAGTVLLLAPAIHSLVRPPPRRLADSGGIADYAQRHWRRRADTAGWILVGVGVFLGPLTSYSADGSHSGLDRLGALVTPHFPGDILPAALLLLGVAFLLTGRVRRFTRREEKVER